MHLMHISIIYFTLGQFAEDRGIHTVAGNAECNQGFTEVRDYGWTPRGRVVGAISLVKLMAFFVLVTISLLGLAHADAMWWLRIVTFIVEFVVAMAVVGPSLR